MSDTTVGVKYDQEKLRWDLLPIEEVEEVVKVLQCGARKYADHNWKKVPDSKRRYFSAALRHIFAWWRGEQMDPETGLHHLAHAMCCLLFAFWHDRNQNQLTDMGAKS